MARKTPTPKEFSAYLVTSSTVEQMPVGATLIDRGALLVRDWTMMNFTTGEETGAVGKRLARVCPDCRTKHNRVGILGHDGECGTDEVRDEAQQVLADAKKRVAA